MTMLLDHDGDTAIAERVVAQSRKQYSKLQSAEAKSPMANLIPPTTKKRVAKKGQPSRKAPRSGKDLQVLG